MYRRLSKKQLALRRILVYILTTLFVITLVSIIILFTLGYRLDTDNGSIEQGALIQFDSQPRNAVVTIDGRELSTRTVSKSTVKAGRHDITIAKDGYQTWTKSLDFTSGTLTWLDYALMIPTNRPVQSVSALPALTAAKASNDGRYILLQENQQQSQFTLADLRSEQIRTSVLTLPDSLYTDATTVGVTHTFQIDEWNNAGRFVLVKHIYNDRQEWLVLDTENVTASRNLTTTLNVQLDKVVFSGTGGTTFYGLGESVVRRLDLSAATISRGLITGVSDFEVYSSTTLTYEGVTSEPTPRPLVGTYREGDDQPHILTMGQPGETLHVAYARYFNDDYFAVSTDQAVSIYRGSYPTADEPGTEGLQAIETFDTSGPIDELVFSPAAEYVVARSGFETSNYEVEHDRLTQTRVTATTTEPRPLMWLNAAYQWNDYDGVLTIREFDGNNGHTINDIASGFDVTLSLNSRYVYSIGKTQTGFQLQRVEINID